VPPIGPTWTDIARRYRGRADAVDVLTAAILAGSGGDEAKRHYAGRTSGVEMPPNLVEVSETDARRLAAWILTFDR
jgi:cytochrome c551/c552